MVQESGFDFSPPSGEWFRFADCPTYQKLCYAGIAEMDFAYWDAARDRLVLLEVKDYTGREAPTHLVNSLIAKGRDCLIMLQSAWRGDAGTGASLCHELPERLRRPSRLQLIFVLKVDDQTRMRPLAEMRDQLRWSLRAYTALLGLEGSTTLMDQEQAVRLGLPLRSV